MNVISIKKKRFNLNLPGVFDATLAPGNVAIYDGDVNCDSASWEDTAGGNSITFFNAPTYNAAGLNGHGTILFNGSTQYGSTTTPAINQPYTIYLVFKQITWTNLDAILADGVTGSKLQFIQLIASPNIRYGNTGAVFQSTDLAINTWGVVTIGMYNGDSILRVNLNSAITGIGDGDPREGITLSALTNLTALGNMEFAYIIMRNVADPIWLQNNFINWLKNRFAI